MNPTYVRANFDRCTIFSRTTSQAWKIRCKLGLWEVESANHEEALQEAFHYWRQYYMDGEYDNLLKSAAK